MGVGSRVRVKNLTSESHLKYNGTLATVVKFDEGYQRWNVMFDLDGENALLKDSKLEVVAVEEKSNIVKAGTKVLFRGLTGTKYDKYEETSGDAIAYNSDIGRWKVRFDYDGAEAYLK